MTRHLYSLALVLCACGGASAPPAHRAPTAPVDDVASPALVEVEGGAALFAERGLHGVFVVRVAGEAAARVIGERAVATQRFVPASTFKVPNTLIGLETGVIPDASFTLPWDGTEHDITEWNRDHDLRGAIQESVVWYYQEVARRVGIDPMRTWVARLAFGNMETGDVVDRFWLDGPLVISSLEQIAFYERLSSGQLPVSERSIAILRDVIVRREQGDATIFGKTGTHLDDRSRHAWLVGWVEREGAAAAWFALLLVPERDALGAQMRMRWDLVIELLAHEGVVPAS